MNTSVLMCLPYFPCIAWVQHALASNHIYLEAHENYARQTYRNRAKILSSNGIISLNIPVLNIQGKQLITEVNTDDNENWKRNHWKSIVSAYGSAPFFQHYAHHFESIYKGSSNINLWDFNMLIVLTIFKILKQPLTFESTTTFIKNPENIVDLRDAFNSKNKEAASELLVNKKYIQVFTEKFSFEPNLSVMDLIYNAGPQALEYLVEEI